MESKKHDLVPTSPNAEQPTQPFEEFFGNIEKLKEIDIFGIEPLLPPTWKDGRF